MRGDHSCAYLELDAHLEFSSREFSTAPASSRGLFARVTLARKPVTRFTRLHCLHINKASVESNPSLIN